MNECKYEIRVLLDQEYTEFSLAKNSTISKLIKIIEIYYEELPQIDYDIIWDKDINLKNIGRNVLLDDVFKRIESKSNHSDIYCCIELTIVKKNHSSSFYIFECIINNTKKILKLSTNLEFQNLKINIVTLFPELELENFSIFYCGNDITNYYDQIKKLDSIFSVTECEKVYPNTIKLDLRVEPKNFVELHKKCKICLKTKATKICKKCAIGYCELCCVTDPHISNQINFISVSRFKEYEHETLGNIQQNFSEMHITNMKLSSNNFSKTTNEKVIAIEKKFEDIIELINSIKDTQIKNFINQIDSIKNKFRPESLEKEIQKFHQIVSSYSDYPFVDIEESSKKIKEFENFSKSFKSEFLDYEKSLQDFTDKYISSSNINQNIYEYLKNYFIESKYLFKSVTINTENYKPVLKVYDNKSVVVYNHNTEEFSLMNFIDIDGMFKENFNNYVQYNYSNHNKLFILTGNPCQKLFCYDYISNEMEYLDSLKHNHNWWPVLLILENTYQDKDNDLLSNTLNILALTGSYTKKCEQIVISGNSKNSRKNKSQIVNARNQIIKEFKDLPDTNSEHGQASAFAINRSIIYILFGYDYNINSISFIERLDINSSSSWELIKFKNPDQISSILYYHSNLVIDENTIFILGGLKEIDQVDFVYYLNLNPIDGEAVLNKTSYNLNLNNIKFCYEKNLLHLNKYEENLNYNNYNDRMSIDLDNTLNFSKINSEINKDLTNRRKFSLSEETLFAIFDSKNNVHLINPKQFKYQFKEFKL